MCENEQIHNVGALAAQRVSRSFGFARRSAGCALLSLLSAWEIRAGEAVFLPALAPEYVLRCVLLCGAVPVFCDISPETLCMSPRELNHRAGQALAQKDLEVRAAIVYNYGGLAPDFERLTELCNSYGLMLAEICPDGIGGAIDGRPLGSFGDASILAFEGSKWGAGVVVTDDAKTARDISLQSRSDPAGIFAPLGDADSRLLMEYMDNSSHNVDIGRAEISRLKRELEHLDCRVVEPRQGCVCTHTEISVVAPSAETGLQLVPEFSPCISPLCSSDLLVGRFSAKRTGFPVAFDLCDRLFVKKAARQ